MPGFFNMTFNETLGRFECGQCGKPSPAVGLSERYDVMNAALAAGWQKLWRRNPELDSEQIFLCPKCFGEFEGFFEPYSRCCVPTSYMIAEHERLAAEAERLTTAGSYEI